MDPCTAAVISKMEEDLDLLGLIDFSSDLISELLELNKDPKNLEVISEMHRDLFSIRNIVEQVYEKKYGEKLIWKSKKVE